MEVLVSDEEKDTFKRYTGHLVMFSICTPAKTKRRGLDRKCAVNLRLSVFIFQFCCSYEIIIVHLL